MGVSKSRTWAPATLTLLGSVRTELFWAPDAVGPAPMPLSGLQSPLSKYPTADSTRPPAVPK
jgi:hypothetical protein